jgi:hypothetical protein
VKCDYFWWTKSNKVVYKCSLRSGELLGNSFAVQKHHFWPNYNFIKSLLACMTKPRPGVERSAASPNKLSIIIPKFNLNYTNNWQLC